MQGNQAYLSKWVFFLGLVFGLSLALVLSTNGTRADS